MLKSFVLLSGGLDSSTALAFAVRDAGVTPQEVEGLSIYYGQRHSKEILCAKKQCDHYHVPHTLISVAGVLEGGMLTDPGQAIPSVSYAELPHGISPTYVPFRNGTMLSVATARAQAWVMEHADDREARIYFGAHAEDAQNWAYPDCTPEFIGAMANAIYVGTYHRVRLFAPFSGATKAEIVKLGATMGVAYEDTWSCYAGGEEHCGVCPTCRARKAAFVTAGVFDPTLYAA